MCWSLENSDRDLLEPGTKLLWTQPNNPTSFTNTMLFHAQNCWCRWPKRSPSPLELNFVLSKFAVFVKADRKGVFEIQIGACQVKLPSLALLRESWVCTWTTHEDPKPLFTDMGNTAPVLLFDQSLRIRQLSCGRRRDFQTLHSAFKFSKKVTGALELESNMHACAEKRAKLQLNECPKEYCFLQAQTKKGRITCWCRRLQLLPPCRPAGK